ncbi:hypothetical protein LINPERHAP2_LOCUS11864 [Linum perenne]
MLVREKCRLWVFLVGRWPSITWRKRCSCRFFQSSRPEYYIDG